jgi:hypothetical protein
MLRGQVWQRLRSFLEGGDLESRIVDTITIRTHEISNPTMKINI